MKPLILTGWPIPEFTKSKFADLAVDFFFRFVWGPLPSPDEITNYLGPLAPDHAPGRHWSDFAARWSQSENRSRRDLSLAEFCQQYETVELWFDTQPNAQLHLVWLLDYFGSHPETVARLKFRLVDLAMIGVDRLGKWQPPAVDVTEKELEMANAAWQAYRQPAPQDWFDLRGKDIGALPQLRQTVLELLEELPMRSGACRVWPRRGAVHGGFARRRQPSRAI
jgi:hypothetical protein